ncbi:glycosyltransferase [Roseovarius amoyensis]|uniref:glycosyltransferase n=1 Tax=Roseovarius amoyensis TaxID=2211448 RepID=UPI000DBE7AD5|nr:glycosyltransferase [Roseovarius amoyensis]
MGISELRRLEMPPGLSPAGRTPLERDLVSRGTVSDGDMRLARRVGQVCDATLDRILTAEGLAQGEELLEAHARHFRSRRVGALALAQMPVAPAGIAPALLLRHGVLPVYDRDGRAALVCHTPEGRAAIRPHLPLEMRDAHTLWATRDIIQDRIAQAFRPALSAAMVTRVPEAESCRRWGRGRRLRLAAVLGMLAAATVVSVMWPGVVLAMLAGWAVVTLVVAILFKTAAFVARLATGPQVPVADRAAGDAPLPRVSVLVPLFKETEIVNALVTRLSCLTYPKCLLEVILVLEETDTRTRDALAVIDLPSWMRPVVVPDGTPRTKPRAMNYALDFCEGDIIGIFDAEDAPDPDQITQVARRFQAAPPDVVCLQGILDYYNPRQNWLARCFTIEYAAWFRLVLPGLARLGFAIPLGGTTLFFRRDALEALGGWDAHNVTEDADLGFRLARHGMRTEMVETVTREEANCLPWPWIKQRSRWLKGYMTTYLVHMRRPRLLRRQLGTWAFLGFQAHFVTALSQVLLAPLLWSFWLVLLGLPHPLDAYLPHGVMLGLGALFLAVEVINLAIHATAVSGRMHRHLLPWTPTMHFYMPLAAVAGYKALYELVRKPFFWDKTKHGLSLGGTSKPEVPVATEEPILRRPPEAQLRQAVDLS